MIDLAKCTSRVHFFEDALTQAKEDRRLAHVRYTVLGSAAALQAYERTVAAWCVQSANLRDAEHELMLLQQSNETAANQTALPFSAEGES